MTLGQILFSLQGRLNRKPYWIFSILILVILLAGALVATVVSSQMMYEAMMSENGTIGPAMAIATYVPLAIGLVILYPSIALMAKRFHDRGKTGKWVLLLLIPVLGKTITDLLGWTGRELSLAEMGIDVTGDEMPSYLEILQKQYAAELRIRPAELAVSAFNFLVTLWFFIELGFFRGTRGPNQYGADPLETTRAT